MPIEAIGAIVANTQQAPPVEPTSSFGAEANIDKIGGLGNEGLPATSQTGTVKPTSFGDALAQQVKSLNSVQQTADTQAQALATGQTQDVTSVVVAAERAQLSMQLATSLRNRAVDAYKDLLATQV